MNDQSPHPVVITLNDQDDVDVELRVWQALAVQVLESEGIEPDAELNVTFVGRDEMTELNETHMGKVGPTDVLSFPLEGVGSDEGHDVPPGQARLLGDVIICPEVVHAQAPAGPRDEMALMVVHGVLHILGMDHREPDEEAAMQAAERRHLDRWREVGVAANAGGLGESAP